MKLYNSTTYSNSNTNDTTTNNNITDTSTDNFDYSSYYFSIEYLIIAFCILIFSNLLSNTHILILKTSFGYSKKNIIILTILTKFGILILLLVLTLIMSIYIDYVFQFYISIAIFLIISILYLIETLKLIENHEDVLTIVDADIYVHNIINEKTELLLPKSQSNCPYSPGLEMKHEDPHKLRKKSVELKSQEFKEKSMFYRSIEEIEEEKALNNKDNYFNNNDDLIIIDQDDEQENDQYNDNIPKIRPRNHSETRVKEPFKTSRTIQIRNNIFNIDNEEEFKLIEQYKAEKRLANPERSRSNNLVKKKNSIKKIRNSIKSSKTNSNLIIIEEADIQNIDNLEKEMEEENILILKKSERKHLEGKFPTKFFRKLLISELYSKSNIGIFALYFSCNHHFLEILIGIVIGVFVMMFLIFSTKFFSNFRIIYWMMISFTFYIVVGILVYTNEHYRVI